MCEKYDSAAARHKARIPRFKRIARGQSLFRTKHATKKVAAQVTQTQTRDADRILRRAAESAIANTGRRKSKRILPPRLLGLRGSSWQSMFVD
jgi:hypothetical protein